MIFGSVNVSLSMISETKLHPGTCLRGLDHVSLWRLIQGHEPTLGGIFKVFSTKIELQLCILLETYQKEQMFEINM